MPYIIDGHNLIPNIPGINLADLDDEQALINLLQQFANQKRTKVEVYFDQAPRSQAGSRSYGSVKAYFISAGTTADQAIIKRLSILGGSAKNWTVVSSDREIMVEAKSLHCQTLNSADFAHLILTDNKGSVHPGEKDPQPNISTDEVDFWLDQFGDE
jgi:predicted RNA-binding protein with PIN domain